MAGFYKIYCIGHEGGVMGADGVNPIYLQILVGTSSQEWLEPHYFDPSLKPLGQIKSLIPAGPDSPHALIDACLAFFPDYFERCPSMAQVRKESKDLSHLDFHLGAEKIPPSWQQLRSEAQSLFQELGVWEAMLVPVEK